MNSRGLLSQPLGARSVWQLTQERLHIAWDDENLPDAFGESVGIFGSQQQTIHILSCAREDIPVLVCLIADLLDATDLLKIKEHAIIDVPWHKTDADPRGCNDVGHCRAEDFGILIGNDETDQHDEDLPETHPKAILQQEGEHHTPSQEHGKILQGFSQ